MPQPYQTLPQLWDYIDKNFNNPKAVNFKETSRWKNISTAEFCREIRLLGLGLLKAGIQPGDKVGIMSLPSPRWILFDQAAISIGAVTVPLFPNISPANLKYEIEESGMTAVFIDGSDLRPLVMDCSPPLQKVIARPDAPEEDSRYLNYSRLRKMGEEANSEEARGYREIRGSLRPEQIATIIYTSGSTGVPKGAEITHGNLISQIDGAAQRFPLDPAHDSALTCLPLAHVFERMVTMFYLSQGIPLYFAEEIQKVGDNLKEVHPTAITLVPRLLEKVHAKMRENVGNTPGWKGKLANLAFQRAKTLPPRRKKTPLDLLLDKLVYGKMRQGLGGRLRLAISGSAPLSTKLCNFFLNLGIPLYEGYGCTETSPVIAANFPGKRKVGTVGPAFPGVEVKIQDDGEILTRGPHVMKGYFKKPEETRESVDSEGWYQTGDLGELDAEGFLRITGRKKEMFKTVHGKYVAPVPIESGLTEESKFIDAAIVVAEGRKYPIAILFPDFEKLDTLKSELDFQGGNGAFLQSDLLKNEMQKTVDKVNQRLNRWEEIQKFIIAQKPITVESGELTPTMKVRRHVLEEQYKDPIEAIYREGKKAEREADQ